MIRRTHDRLERRCHALRALRRRRLVPAALVLAALAVAGPSVARSQGPAAAAPDFHFAALPASGVAVPFRVGERADYDVRFGALPVGSASTLVADVETLRGTPVWHTIFQLKAGTFFYHVNDVFESWIDTTNFASLQFFQTQHEGLQERRKRYEIYPEQGTYVEMDKTPPREHRGVHDPLDDGSFLFFLRTVPLEVGKTYQSDRYFRPERNPVRIRVLRRETVQVPAGTFDCIVVQPVIKTEGIFSEDGQAEVWLSDDPRHVVVQLKSKLSFGSINLYLRSYTPGA